MSLKDNLKKLNSVVSLDTDIPEIGTVYVKVLSARESFSFNSALEKYRGKDNENELFSCVLIAYTLVDESGNRIYTDEEIESILDLPAKFILAVVNKSQQLNFMTEASKQELKKS